MDKSGNILEVRDLRVAYHDGVKAIEGISFAVPPSCRVGLIGPNGAGKTTLMLAVLRGIEYSGQIVIDGMELSRHTVDQARSCCGMMFQDADDQLFMPTLLDDVAFGPLNQGMAADAAASAAQAAIATVGLAGLEARCAHHLSGGQKRCAALATVLSMNVRLLLLDEPASNLDFRSRERLVELLSSRSEAMLLASHDLDMVRRLCHRVILLDNGKIAAEGSTAEILDDRALLQKHGLA